MYDIITIGSASIDAFVKTKSELIHHNNHLDLAYLLGGKIIVDNLKFTTGGGATNTAVAFSRLGLKTACICAIGNDSNGQTILHELKKEKIDFLGSIKKGATGYSIILPAPNDRVILTYKGVNNDLSWKDINTGLFNTKWLYVSTMLGKSLETAEKLIARAKEQGAKIALNLSPYLAEKGIAKLSKLLKPADILIMNKEEALSLSAKKEIKPAIKEISKHAKSLLVITDGIKPVHVYDWKKDYTMKVKAVKPVDSTGAGDAFASGFVYGIIKEKGIERALGYGCKEAASTIKAIGAKNNLLKRL